MMEQFAKRVGLVGESVGLAAGVSVYVSDAG